MAAAPVPPAPLADAAPAPLSQGARIIDTFIAPSKTFTDIRRSAAWWAPWILISIVSLVFVYVMSQKIGFEQIARNGVAHSSRADQFDKLPADQQARQIQFTVKIIGFFSYGSPFLILFYLLISSVVLWLTFKLVAGAETTFSQAYATVMYAGLPGIIGAILGILSLVAGVNPEGFDPNNPVGTNLGYYLDAETTGKFLRGIASSLDVINIWTIALLSIGFACTGKVKRSTAITIVVVWYLIWELGKAGLGSLG